jgi:hypothetical protein
MEEVDSTKASAVKTPGEQSIIYPLYQLNVEVLDFLGALDFLEALDFCS